MAGSKGFNIFGETSEQVIKRLQTDKTEALRALKNARDALTYCIGVLTADPLAQKITVTRDAATTVLDSVAKTDRRQP